MGPLQGITGAQFHISGQTQLLLDKINISLGVDVIKSMGHEMIIGQDALRLGKGVINLKIMNWIGLVKYGHYCATRVVSF